MVVARIILVAVIAVSVAMVPVVGGVAVLSQSMQASMSDHGGMSCNKATDDCKNFAGCALKCFNFPGAIDSELVLIPRALAIEPSFIEKAARPHPGSPPTRPPPV